MVSGPHPVFNHILTFEGRTLECNPITLALCYLLILNCLIDWLLIYYFFAFCLQKTPVSRFIIGYCGAVTSAVGIAVGRFVFIVMVVVVVVVVVVDILCSLHIRALLFN